MIFFFFNDTATTEIYTLSLHDALPISRQERELPQQVRLAGGRGRGVDERLHATHVEHRVHVDLPLPLHLDRKSTRLNSSHSQISYAVFCLKKKTFVVRLALSGIILVPA